MKFPSHFDLIAPFYEIVIPSAHTEELVQIGKFPVEGYILDIGGGTGRVPRFWRMFKEILLSSILVRQC